MSPKHLHAPAVVLALFASAGFAAEQIPTQPQPAAIALVADPAAGLADLDVNRTEHLELQQEISREKQATQRRLLELQLDFATRDGDRARIEQATAALAAWDAPRPVLTPVDRPVPANPER